MEQEKKSLSPPRMSPYVFTFLLIGFGLWCSWDGWLTNDPDMMKHANFNRILSIVLLSWGMYDFFKIRKKQRNKKQSED